MQKFAIILCTVLAIMAFGGEQNSKGQPTSTGFGRVKLKVNGQRVTCEKLAEMARSALKQKEPSAIMEG